MNALDHRRLPPGPQGPEMLRNIGLMVRRPPDFLAQCADRYGPVVRFPIPRSEVWLVTDPDDVRQVLKSNHQAYDKRTIQYDALAQITGNGLLVSDAEVWRRMRRVLSPGFHHQLVADMVTTVQATTAAWIDEVLAAPGAREVDLDQAVLELSLDLVAACLLGVEIADSRRLVDAIAVALGQVIDGARQPWSLPERVVTPGRRRLRSARQVIDAAVRDLIGSRRSRPAGTDVLSLLLAARDAGSVTDSEVRDEVVTLLIAGHETVAATITWTFLLLAAHPEAEQRVTAEADSLPGSTWTPAVLDALPYTRAAVDECLRLYPPAWVLTRRCRHSDVLGGYHVPAGATVIMSPWVTHRDGRLWRDPRQFDPDRFAPGERAQATGRLSYFPFGAGPRLCIGRELALLEAPLVVAAVTRAVRVRPCRPASVAPDFGVTVRPAGGMSAQLSLRVR